MNWHLEYNMFWNEIYFSPTEGVALCLVFFIKSIGSLGKPIESSEQINCGITWSINQLSPMSSYLKDCELVCTLTCRTDFRQLRHDTDSCEDLWNVKSYLLWAHSRPKVAWVRLMGEWRTSYFCHRCPFSNKYIFSIFLHSYLESFILFDSGPPL